MKTVYKYLVSIGKFSTSFRNIKLCEGELVISFGTPMSVFAISKDEK